MRIDYVSINSLIQNDTPDIQCVGGPYKISAELDSCPLELWKKNFNNIWHESKYYSTYKEDIIIKDNCLEIIVKQSENIQSCIESLNFSIILTENLLKSINIKKHSRYNRNYLKVIVK